MGTNQGWTINAKSACNHLGKEEFYVGYGSMDIFYNLSHFVPFLPTFCPTQGYLIKVYGSHSYACTIHWISGKVPPRSHADASIYMLLIL
jgi:hypothetical protein